MAHDDTLSSSARRPRRAHGVLALVGGTIAATALWSSTADASTAYAYILASAFDFGGGCPACHTNATGGIGTAKQPFAQTLMGLGLKANDTDSLYVAITELSSSDVDSDGDMIADFDELAPDGDPNDPNVFPEDATPVPPAPPPATAPPPAVAPPPATATPPSTGSPPPPAAPPSPSPAPATGKDDGGCSSSGSGGSRLPVAFLALFGLAYLARRR